MTFCKVLLANIRASAESRQGIVLRAAMMAINNFVFFTMWLVLFGQGFALDEWSLGRTMLLFGLTSAAFGVALGSLAGFPRLSEMIRTGEFNAVLLRPKDPLLLVLVSRSEPAAWGDLVSGLVLIALSQQLSLLGWLLLPVALLLAAVVVVSAGVAFFSVAFWMDRSDTLAFRLWETLIMFSLYPEAIFPIGFRVLFYTVIPAAFVAFLPLRMLLEPSFASALVLALCTACWALLAVSIFRLGLRRYVTH